MNNSSDSDKTDVDQSEISPDAKKCFYSPKRVPSNSNISIVLEPDTPSTRSVSSSSPEKSIVSESPPDVEVTNSLSKTSCSFPNKPEVSPSDILKTGDSNNKLETENCNMLITIADSENIVKGLETPVDTVSGPPNVDVSIMNIAESSTHLKMSRLDNNDGSSNVNKQINSLATTGIQHRSKPFHCDCGKPAGSEEERLLCKHQSIIKQENNSLHDPEKRISSLLKRRIHEYNRKNVGCCREEKLDQVVVLSDDDSDASSVIELISSDDDVKEVVAEKENMAFTGVSNRQPSAYQFSSFLESCTQFTNLNNMTTNVNVSITQPMVTVENMRFNNKYSNYLNTVTIDNDDNAINTMSNQYKAREDDSQLSRITSSSNYKNMHTSNENDCEENDLYNTDNVQNMQLKNNNILKDLVNEYKKCLSSEKTIDVDEYISTVGSATDSDTSDSPNKDNNAHIPNGHGVSIENHHLSNNVNDESSEFNNINILIDLVDEDKEGYSSEKTNVDEDISDVESITISGGSDMLCKDAVVEDMDNKMHSRKENIDNINTHTPNEHNVSNENNLSNIVNDESSEFNNINILIDLVDEDKEGHSSEKINVDEDISDVESITNSGGSDVLCEDTIVKDKDNDTHSSKEAIVNSENNANVICNVDEPVNLSEINADTDRCVSKPEDFENKSNSANNQTVGNSTDEFECISMLIDIIDKGEVCIPTRGKVNCECHPNTLNDEEHELIHTTPTLSNNKGNQESLVKAGDELDNLKNKHSPNMAAYKGSNIISEVTIDKTSIGITNDQPVTSRADLVTTENNTVRSEAYPIKSNVGSMSMETECSINVEDDSREQIVLCEDEDTSINAEDDSREQIDLCEDEDTSINAEDDSREQGVSCEDKDTSINAEDNSREQIVLCDDEDTSINAEDDSREQIILCEDEDTSINAEDDSREQGVSCEDKDTSINAEDNSREQIVLCEDEDTSINAERDSREQIVLCEDKDASINAEHDSREQGVSCEDKDSLQTHKEQLLDSNVESINENFTKKVKKRQKKKKRKLAIQGMAMYLNNFIESPYKKSCTDEICDDIVHDKVICLDEYTETENIDSITRGNIEHMKVDNIACEESKHEKPIISSEIFTPENSDMSSLSHNMENNIKSGIILPIVPALNIHKNDKSPNYPNSSVEIDGDNSSVSFKPNEAGDSSPVYNLPPQQVASSFTEFQCKLENHLRGCLWSPDGSSILTNSDDNLLRIFTIPDDLIDKTLTEELTPCVRMNEGETVYDMDWYPFMDSTNPDTCCFVSTSRDHPIHLWDACSGTVRCSYTARNQLDELVSPHCVAFNSDGSKIYCGFDKCIRIFDSSRPGTECSERCTIARKNQSKKGKYKHTLNQGGIISSIAFSHYSGLYALGSFSRTVGLYDVNDGKPHCLLNGHTGGVTQVKFTDDGYYLISGARKDAELVWWDLRNTTIPLFKLLRNVSTNQRIQFDIDHGGFRVYSGGTDKMVNIWDLKNIFDEVQEDVICYEPTFQFCAHDDAVNAVCLHPSKPLLASTSGQRHFFVESDSDSMETDLTNSINRFENSLKIWKLFL